MHKKKGRGGGRGRQEKIATDKTCMWTEVLDKSQSKDSSHLLSISVGLLSLCLSPPAVPSSQFYTHQEKGNFYVNL